MFCRRSVDHRRYFALPWADVLERSREVFLQVCKGVGAVVWEHLLDIALQPRLVSLSEQEAYPLQPVCVVLSAGWQAQTAIFVREEAISIEEPAKP